MTKYVFLIILTVAGIIVGELMGIESCLAGGLLGFFLAVAYLAFESAWQGMDFSGVRDALDESASFDDDGFGDSFGGDAD